MLAADALWSRVGMHGRRKNIVNAETVAALLCLHGSFANFALNQRATTTRSSGSDSSSPINWSARCAARRGASSERSRTVFSRQDCVLMEGIESRAGIPSSVHLNTIHAKPNPARSHIARTRHGSLMRCRGSHDFLAEGRFRTGAKRTARRSPTAPEAGGAQNRFRAAAEPTGARRTIGSNAPSRPPSLSPSTHLHRNPI